MTVCSPLNGIRAQRRPTCGLCGARGDELYSALHDRLYGAPGIWNLRRCPRVNCGLIWLDPMPVEEDLAKAYRTYYTHQGGTSTTSTLKRFVGFLGEGYLTVRYGYRRAETSLVKKCLGMMVYGAMLRRARLDFRLMHLPVQSGGRLLEVGCGNGEMMGILQEAGWKTEGMDVDAAAVAIACNHGLHVSVGTLESQRYASDAFDAVTSSHTIEHLYDPAQFLRECHRILGPGGQLAIVTPNSRSLCHRFFKESWMPLDPPRHLHIFTLNSLRRLVTEAGFRNIRAWTTIRDANRLFASSQEIRRTGQHVWGSPQPHSVRAAGKVFQCIEYMAVTCGYEAGEEIAVTAEK